MRDRGVEHFEGKVQKDNGGGVLSASVASQRGISRREFLSRSLKAGVSISAAGALLASCGGTEQGGGGTQGTQGGGGGSSTITIAINESPWLPSFRTVVDAYRQETGSTINLRTFPYSGLLSKQLNAANTQTGEFDIFTMDTPWCSTFYDGGLLTPLNEIDSSFEWPSEVIDYKDVGRWDSEASYFSQDGTPYALPVNGNIQVLFYREDLYEQMDLEPPTTWDETIAAAKKIQEVDSDVYGYLVRGSGATPFFLPLLYGFGGSVLANPPEDWSVTINSDEAQQALELFIELSSYGPENPATVEQSDMTALLQSGRALQTHLVVAIQDQLSDETQSSVAGKMNYSVVPKPQNGEHASAIGVWWMGIPTYAAEERKQAAYDFLTWAMGRDVQMNYAQEGGIPTRQDIYESLANDDEFRWMNAVAESTPYLRRKLDYPFGTEVEEVTDRRLSEALGGQITPKMALNSMADEIAQVVERAGH